MDIRSPSNPRYNPNYKYSLKASTLIRTKLTGTPDRAQPDLGVPVAEEAELAFPVSPVLVVDAPTVKVGLNTTSEPSRNVRTA